MADHERKSSNLTRFILKKRYLSCIYALVLASINAIGGGTFAQSVVYLQYLNSACMVKKRDN